MVQVDVFWSYALGASFASAASRQLKNENNPFQNDYFTYTILYLSCIFAPSGIYLLWQFPHWETMQAASCHGDLPAWLVTVFSITNITQGILGFWVSYQFIQSGRYYLAHLQWFLGYFCMFFVLVHGWDGLGWQRFLYDPTVLNNQLWEPGQHMGLTFLWSNVAFTLYGMGIFVIPFMIIPMSKWIIEGAKNSPEVNSSDIPKSIQEICIPFFILVIGCSLGGAIVTSILIFVLKLITGNLMVSILFGMSINLFLAYYFFFQEEKKGYELFKKLFLAEPV
ncbi:MAG: hypothetical protein OMM_02753 [Candidatus Magnetoglobus multicellularis str. Araruama]|uniref:Uncharacterized protein n=1 Tax=Candidatus Magnetoglobus multicellularis str. Araruama TaxID=890399 RepID=A0A1V1P8H9_9BACT|nr:MAG: hypothetical protein OMM_02753 [Candidatus Magnetoglobus multicellularis str. Araruama]